MRVTIENDRPIKSSLVIHETILQVKIFFSLVYFKHFLTELCPFRLYRIHQNIGPIFVSHKNL